MNGNLKNTSLKVEGDIMIEKSLLKLFQIGEVADAEDVNDVNNVGYEKDVNEDIMGDGKDSATVSTHKLIWMIRQLLKQESDLIEARYQSLSDFCDKQIKNGQDDPNYLQKIDYLNQHLNNYYFQDQWTINGILSMSDRFKQFKQPMAITVLPSLRIFNYETMFDDSYHKYIWELFEEKFDVNLLPGIYVYNFRVSDNTTDTNKVIKLLYYGNNLGEHNYFKIVEFEPYTLYYIKQKNTTGATITITDKEKNSNVYTYAYKCVIVMSGIDPDTGDNAFNDPYTKLGPNLICYKEYYVYDPTGSDNSSNYQSFTKKNWCKGFNIIDRTDINNPIKEDEDPSLKYTQPTQYWTVNGFQKIKPYDENFIIGSLATGDIDQWVYASGETIVNGYNMVDRVAYIFKLSGDEYLKYEMQMTFDDGSEPEISLDLKKINTQDPAAATIYYLNEDQAIKNQELINQK